MAVIVQHRGFAPAQLERFKAGQRASYGVLEEVAAGLGAGCGRSSRISAKGISARNGRSCW